MRVLKLSTVSLLLVMAQFGSMVFAQQTVFSRAEATTGNWWDGSNPWKRLCDDWFLDRPDKNECFNFSDIGRNDIFIGHNDNNPMTVNGAWFQVRNLSIQLEVTISRTYNSAGGGISLSGGIYNSSAQQQNFNVPIGVDGAVVQFEAFNGGFSFSQDFFINSNTAEFLGAFNTTVSGVMSGSNGKVTKNGTGTLTLTNSGNTYTGATTINAGNLVLNPSANSNINTPFVLNGGSLSTNAISAGRVINNSSTMALTASSSITLGAASHELKFANSSAVIWTGATSLTINGWTGTAGLSGTGGKVFFGSDVSGLTATQLSQISFSGYPNTAMILPTGEIVPNPSGLPVELSNFSVSCSANDLSVLFWETASELNASHFLIHRSTDGINWEVIGEKVAHGTTNNVNTYLFIDEDTPRSTTHFYQLEQFDLNGESKLYPALSSSCSGNTIEVNLFPNPSEAFINLTFQWKNTPENFQLHLFDAQGKIVFSQKVKASIGNNFIEIPTFNLAPGQYFIMLPDLNNSFEILKFIKQ